MTVARWPRACSELLVALFLLVLGVVVVVDTAGMETGFLQRGPVGPKVVPTAVGILLGVVGVLLAVDVLRGGRGAPESGEDTDLSAGMDWRSTALLVGAFLANVVLVERVGWPLSGALLFWGTAYALGSRHLLRDPLIALALSVTTYLVFTRGLGIVLPAGVLEGLL